MSHRRRYSGTSGDGFNAHGALRDQQETTSLRAPGLSLPHLTPKTITPSTVARNVVVAEVGHSWFVPSTMEAE